jgi:hypothetical protein
LRFSGSLAQNPSARYLVRFVLLVGV